VQVSDTQVINAQMSDTKPVLEDTKPVLESQVFATHVHPEIKS